MSAYTLSGPEAGAIAARGRLLLRRRVITHAQHSLLTALLFGARRPGSAVLVASLATLARIAGQARSTATEGIARLEDLGLLQRVRRRVRVAWAGSIASRVVANAYRLVVPDTETDGRSAREEHLVIYTMAEAPSVAHRAAAEVLAQRQKALEERWRARRTGVRPYSCIGA
jgi:hypothetical protein